MDRTNAQVARVYQYGTVPARIAPVYGEDRAHEQLWLVNRLWNLLVAIERRREARYRAIMRDEIQERIDALCAEIAEIRDEIRKRRKQARSRKVDVKSLQAKLNDLLAELKNLLEQRRTTSKARHAAKRHELRALSDITKRRIKRARQAAAARGLFWGTYNDIVQRSDVGRKAGTLRFRRFTGDGTLTAQVMGGASVGATIGGDHTFFRAEPGGVRWRYASMRVGSTEKREPVWLRIPIVYHRPIPEDARIKSVSMTRSGGRWSLNVTVTVPAPAPSMKQDALAIDIGWRRRENGVRVAYKVDSRGVRMSVEIPESDVKAFEQVASLRSTCDLLMGEFLPALSAWIAQRELPDDWKQKSSHLSQWRSGDRLCRLIRWWGDHRLPDDGEIYQHACEWRLKYLHVANWRRNLEGKTRRRVRERYRIEANRIARSYGTVYIEHFDLRTVAKRPAVESDEVRTAAARYRQMASPSVFRAAVRNACLREGVRVVEVDAALTTRQCHQCGYAGEWDQAEAVLHTCEKCGSLWDQDYNAAVQILRRGASAKAAQPVEHGQRERKWDRVKRLSQGVSQEVDLVDVIK